MPFQTRTELSNAFGQNNRLRVNTTSDGIVSNFPATHQLMMLSSQPNTHDENDRSLSPDYFTLTKGGENKRTALPLSTIGSSFKNPQHSETQVDEQTQETDHTSVFNRNKTAFNHLLLSGDQMLDINVNALRMSMRD